MNLLLLETNLLRGNTPAVALTVAGSNLSEVVPIPNCPKLLLPQQKTFPALTTAQECSSPAATAIIKGPVVERNIQSLSD